MVVACILAKRTPPDYEGLKMPTLPPADVFAPTLVKLLNDPQSEVVEHVVAPEVLAEMAKVVPMDLIVPRVLLLSEGDDEQHAQHINTSTIPVLKQLMSDYDATELLFKVIQSMSASGVFTRKPASGSFTPAQKRKITHGCLRWMNELAEAYVNGEPNAFFGDRSNYKLLLNRFIQMLNTTKAQNYTMLAALLRNLQNIDSETFNKTLATFEATTARELKRAWGHSEEEETEDIVVEEKVADVEQVLGSVPAVGGSVPGPARSRTPSAESVPRSIMLPQDLEDIKNSPPLAQSPVRENPIIKVYQDPITESDTGVVLELSAISDGKESQNYGVGKFIRTGTNLTKNDGPPKNPGENARTLETLIRRIQSRDIDTQAFKKLTGIAKENPVREPLQEANGEDLYDIWQGGPVFEELLTSLLEYLKAEDVSWIPWSVLLIVLIIAHID